MRTQQQVVFFCPGAHFRFLALEDGGDGGGGEGQVHVGHGAHAGHTGQTTGGGGGGHVVQGTILVFSTYLESSIQGQNAGVDS